MTVIVFTVIVFFSSVVAGLIGSLTGLGGGVVLIPLLTLVFKVDIHYAIGTSLISVIATSSGCIDCCSSRFSLIRIPRKNHYSFMYPDLQVLLEQVIKTNVPSFHEYNKKSF